MPQQSINKRKKGNTSGKGKSVYLEIGVWHNRKTGHIHMAAKKGARFISTVSDAPNLKDSIPVFMRNCEVYYKSKADGKWCGLPFSNI